MPNVPSLAEVERFMRSGPPPRNWSSHAAIHDEPIYTDAPLPSEDGVVIALTRYEELLKIEREWLQSLPTS